MFKTNYLLGMKFYKTSWLELGDAKQLEQDCTRISHRTLTVSYHCVFREPFHVPNSFEHFCKPFIVILFKIFYRTAHKI